MDNKTKIRLTAAEISALWMQYVNDTASICINSHFLSKAEDDQVRPVIEFALESSKRNISFLKNLFLAEGFPPPLGFTKEDVKPNAPKLFSDSYALMYLRNMSVLGMASSSGAIGLSTREDVISFF